MIISEETGRISGFNFDSRSGMLTLQVEVLRGNVNCELECVDMSFEYNRNRPYSFRLDKLSGKKVKITVELIED